MAESNLRSKLVVRDLLHRGSQLRGDIEWQPFRSGIRIHWLYKSDGGSSAALLCFEPGATVPPHEHLGYEHIMVLDGAQSDEHGTYQAGTMVVNPPHTRHRVTSEGGCIVLIIWEKGVKFMDP